MASTIVGKSGHVYVQGEALQQHRENHKLSVFKAEYVLNVMTFSQLSYISDLSYSGPAMSLLSSSTFPSRSTNDLFASHPSLQAHVTFVYISIATRKSVF